MTTESWDIIVVAVLAIAVILLMVLVIRDSNKPYEMEIDLSGCTTLDQKLRLVLAEMYQFDGIKIINIEIQGSGPEIKTDKIESKDLVNAKMVKIHFLL